MRFGVGLRNARVAALSIQQFVRFCFSDRWSVDHGHRTAHLVSMMVDGEGASVAEKGRVADGGKRRH